MIDFPDAPPDDVEALTFRLTVSVKTLGPPNPDGSQSVEFDYHCEECGGCVISLPLGSGPDDPALCKACGRWFGKYKAVLAQCRNEFRRYSAEAGSGSSGARLNADG